MGLVSSTLSVHDDGALPIAESVPCLVRVLQCDAPLEPSERLLLGRFETVTFGRGDRTANVATGSALDLKLADERMSTVHSRLTLAGGTAILEDAGSKNGTVVNGQPCSRSELADGDVIEMGHTFFVYRARVSPELPGGPARMGVPLLATFVGSFARQLEMLARVAPSGLPVIALGETGTGKEVLARGVHAASGRTGAFIAVNCGAIPATLVESELFGSKKGAFTGAVADRPGLVRSADGGTLFLDEIAELPLPAQVALLRVIQEREVMAVGDARATPVDVRIIAATHQPLDRLADSGEFRADLYGRLSGMTVRLPALRDRRDDFGLILANVLAALGSPYPVRFTRRAARALFAYAFPRNIRELEKVIGLAATVAGDAEIDLAHLPDEIVAAPAKAAERAAAPDLTDEARKAMLIQLLTTHRGRISAVARAMGKARMQIHRWIERYGIDLELYRRT
jgi:transcriptional regulator with AAA-type ATPase domain